MKRFTVIDTFNCYMLLDTVTGQEACMGDGVDQPFGEIGTEEFRQAWEKDANENSYEYFWARFPELYELEIWQDDRQVTVFTGRWAEEYPEVLVIAGPVSRFSRSKPGPHLGKIVPFLGLPQKLQRRIAEKLEG